MTMYEITDDIKALQSLLESLVDENGDPREPDADEQATLKGFFDEALANFEAKFDGICKFSVNLKNEAACADAERKAHKDEMDRLSRRAKAATARRDRVISWLRYCMDRIGQKKYKTALFSTTIQANPPTVKADSILESKNLAGVPEKFLKRRELDSKAILEAVKSGELRRGNADNPIERDAIFFAESGEKIEGLCYVQGDHLVIR